MHHTEGADDDSLTLGQSDAALDTLMGALAELDVLATVGDPHRLIATAQIAYGQNDEVFKDLRACLARALPFLQALHDVLTSRGRRKYILAYMVSWIEPPRRECYDARVGRAQPTGEHSPHLLPGRVK